MKNNEKIENSSRNVVFLDEKRYLEQLECLFETVRKQQLIQNVLVCGNEFDPTLESICDIFTDCQRVIMHFNRLTADDFVCDEYQICVVKGYELYYHFIPAIIEKLRSKGSIIFIHKEGDMSLFTRRFRLKLETCHGSINSKKTIQSTNDMKRIVEYLTSNFDGNKQMKSIVTLIKGLKCRGKQSIIAQGIAAAVHGGVSDIYVLGANDGVLRISCTLVQMSLRDLGITLSMRRMDKYFLLESADNETLRKIRFVRFDQGFSKYDTTLLCIIEAGQLSVTQLYKVLSYNPRFVWVTASTGGYQSSGVAVVTQLDRILLSFCKAIEVPTKEIVEKGDVSIVELCNAFDKKLYSVVTMTNPVIYDTNDVLEKCTNELLCLNRNLLPSKVEASGVYSAPGDCQLMYVDKSTLFSGHPAAELLLARFMELYTAFEKKRTNEFLCQFVDSVADHLFCLQQPNATGRMPEIYCIAHVAFSEATYLLNNSTGKQVKIVKIITNHRYLKSGYAQQMLKMLHSYFSKPEQNNDDHIMCRRAPSFSSIDLVSFENLPILMVNVTDLSPLPFPVDFIFAKFEADVNLIRFWKKCLYIPVEVEALSSSKFRCTMLRNCQDGFSKDLESAYFRMCQGIGDQLLKQLQDVDVPLAYEIIYNKDRPNMKIFKDCTIKDIAVRGLNGRQLRKLNSFTQNTHSFESIQDCVHRIAQILITHRLRGVYLSNSQEMVMVGCGLQLKPLQQLAKEMILSEQYERASLMDPFQLRKEVKQKVTVLVSHVRECVLSFLNYVTRRIEEERDEEDAVPAKKQKIM